MINYLLSFARGEVIAVEAIVIPHSHHKHIFFLHEHSIKIVQLGWARSQ